MAINLPSYAPGQCEKTLEVAKSKVEGLGPRLDKVLSETAKKLTPVWGRAYVNG